MKAGTFGTRLRGRTVVLAVERMPEGRDYKAAEFGNWDVDQAVIALTRAVLAEGGRLAISGEPELTLLVAMVAGEYQQQRFAEGTGPAETPEVAVRLYRPGGRSEQQFQDEQLLEHFQLVSIEDENDSAAISPHARASRLFDQERPAALVCVGGGSELLAQAAAFRSRAQYGPIFAFDSINGASWGDAGPDLQVRKIDQPIVAATRERARARRFDGATEPATRRAELEEQVVPYPVIMQLIVDQIARDDRSKIRS